MFTDGIFPDGHCCNYEDTENIENNRTTLINSLERHLQKIKERLGIAKT